MHTLEQLRSGALAGFQRVGLSARLTEFPTEIFQVAESLEILDLSGNALRTLPDDLPRLHKLRILFCSNNQFTELPPVLGQCHTLQMIGFKANQIRSVPARSLPPLLRWLTLTDNQIEELPKEIGQCAHLQKLMLAGNRLRALPASLAGCHRLELLRIAANDFAVLPQWLLDLPRLSWLAFGGNPLGAELEATALAYSGTDVPFIPWPSLQLHELLGEGASGRIHRTTVSENGSTQTAAVKLFKGAMTSDGLPQSELAACLRAGRHRHLIAVRGRVGAHPQGSEGLVMDLVNPAFQTLAAPPSLESCTRDVYVPGRRFDLAAALRIAYAMASVACHLHRQGVLHGDLYAHNTLHTAHGEAMLGDFGAATLYSPEDVTLSESLQRVEARAFGCLLQELLERADAGNGSQAVVEDLQRLVSRCLSESPRKRPLFAETEALLGHAMAALEI